jgi:hypothetical protein
MVQKFRKELIDAASVKSENCNVIYQINFQIFPLTDKLDGASE